MQNILNITTFNKRFEYQYFKQEQLMLDIVLIVDVAAEVRH